MTPSVSLKQELSAWAFSARLQAVGSLLGIPVDALLAEVAAAPPAEDPRRPRRRLSTTLDFDRVALLIRGRGDDELARLAGGGSLVEVTARGREGYLTIARHAFRSAGLDADLALLRRFAAFSFAEAAELAARLAPGKISAGVSVGHDEAGGRRVTLHVPVVGPAGLDALIDCASALGVTSPQRRLVARLHPILAPAGRPALAALHLVPEGGGGAPELAVTYHALAHEALIRLMAGLRPGPEPAARIGKIAGAAGAEEVAALTLGLRDQEPPTLGVAFDMVRS